MLNGNGDIPRYVKIISAVLAIIIALVTAGAFLVAPIATDVENIKKDVEYNREQNVQTQHQLHGLEREVIERLSRIEAGVENLQEKVD
ncbi:MAG: hypothetical protein R3268_00095 [Acidiferrobacterales bacterium]|nr:hypothetical protein [Acidiferrobacterales bacterium]